MIARLPPYDSRDFQHKAAFVGGPGRIHVGRYRASGLMSKLGEINCSDPAAWTITHSSATYGGIDAVNALTARLVGSNYVQGGVTFTKTTAYAELDLVGELDAPVDTTNAWLYMRMYWTNPDKLNYSGGYTSLLGYKNELDPPFTVGIHYVPTVTCDPVWVEFWRPLLTAGNMSTLELHFLTATTGAQPTITIDAVELWSKPTKPVVILCLDDFAAGGTPNIPTDRMEAAAYAIAKNVPLSLACITGQYSGLTDATWQQLRRFQEAGHCPVNGTHGHLEWAEGSSLEARRADVTRATEAMCDHGLVEGSRCVMLPGSFTSHPWSLFSANDMDGVGDLHCGFSLVGANHYGQSRLLMNYTAFDSDPQIATATGWIDSAITWNNILNLDTDLAVGGFPRIRQVIDYMATKRAAGEILIRTYADYAYGRLATPVLY